MADSAHATPDLPALPVIGLPSAEVLDALEAHRAQDVRWEDGRAFSLAYSAGEEVLALQKAALAGWHSTNALNTDAFPSLKRLQADVIGTVATLFHGGTDAVGVFTSGGTESILTSVKGARERAHAAGNDAPQMVLPTTAHAAFSKAAKYFGIEAIRVPVGDDYRADPDAMAAAVTDRTALLVASAPTYPQGVIDPIAEIGALAADRDLMFHVDSCMGFTLPWLDRLGVELPPFDFRVPGVTQISCDLHKFGYTAKGASVLVHRTKDLRKHQFFLTSDWLGGLYGSPAILGTRSGGSLAAAWAVMRHLGQDGYLRLTKQAYEARRSIQTGIEAIDGLAVRGEPVATLLAFGAADAPRTGGPGSIDIYAVGDQLWRDGGWYCDRQTPPDSLHLTVNAVHAGRVDEFVAAVADAVAFVSGDPSLTGDRTKAYGTL